MKEIKTNHYSETIQVIKSAILKSRYRAAALANRELLSLYYGIGKYISENSRRGFWGTRAIETISERLQQELPGLRGFSPVNIKRMIHYYVNSSLLNFKSFPLTLSLLIPKPFHYHTQHPVLR